jgi:hypothetical protein
LIRDPEGSFHDDLEGARSEAVESARELMADGILSEGQIGIERSITICDARGTALLVLPFRDAIAPLTAVAPPSYSDATKQSYMRRLSGTRGA